MTEDSPARTIAVTTRCRSRFAWLKVRYPDAAQHPRYSTELARELLARTAELPDTKRGLIIVLTEYRHALAALIATPGADDKTSASTSAEPPAGLLDSYRTRRRTAHAR